MKTEDFSDAVWLKTAGTIVNSAVSNPINAAQVSKFVPDTTNAIHRIAHPWNPSLGVNYTQTILLKSAGVRYVNLNVWANIQNRTTIDLQTGATISTGTAVINVMVNSLSDGWFLLSITGLGTAAVGNNTWIQASNALIASDSTYAGDGVSGFYLIAADLRIGTTSGPYQRVNTSTDYNTDERYFPKYLRFDGVDDYLNLPYMGLYAGGSASIVCARDAVSQTTDTYIISERSTTDADPKYFPSRQLNSAGNMDTYIADNAGAVVLDTAGSPFSGVANAVIRSIVDSGNNLKLFKNGVLAANDNYTRSGTLTLNNTTIGASVSTTTSNYASMKLYWLIVTKSALTDAQRIKCERHLSRKSGVTL
jgi:hypothetical protein